MVGDGGLASFRKLFYKESGRGEPLCSVTPLKLFAFVVQY
jgi:hypothetical protein